MLTSEKPRPFIETEAYARIRAAIEAAISAERKACAEIANNAVDMAYKLYGADQKRRMGYKDAAEYIGAMIRERDNQPT